MKKLFFVAICLGVLVGCDDDYELCPEGYDYNQDVRLCMKAFSFDDTSTGGEDTTDGDAGTAGDGAVSGSGIGEPCADQPDCAQYEASACAVSPMTPDEPGYCTFADCDPGGCPAGYKCCDCSTSTMVPEDQRGVVCLRDAMAAMAGMGGCMCA